MKVETKLAALLEYAGARTASCPMPPEGSALGRCVRIARRQETGAVAAA